MKKDVLSLAKPSFFRWTFSVFLDWFIIFTVGAAAVYSKNIFVFWIASLIIGNRQHAIAFLGHDGAHRAISKKPTFNDLWNGLLAMWPLGVGLTGYRKFHFQHHRHVGTLKDPELLHKTWADPEFSLPLKKRKILFLLLRDLCGGGVVDIVRLVKLTPPASVLDVVGPLMMTAFFWYVCLSTGHYEILALWYFSQISSFWATFRLRIFIEHLGSRGTHRVRLSKPLQLIVAPHGAAFHYEHHRWPSIPCWNLEQARSYCDREPVLTLAQLISKFENQATLPSGALPPTLDKAV